MTTIPQAPSLHEDPLEAELAYNRLLHSISMELIHNNNIDALYEKIIDAATGIMHADCATLQMLHPERGDGGALHLIAYRGFPAEAAARWEWVDVNSLWTVSGKAVRERRRIVVPDLAQCDYVAGSEHFTRVREANIASCQTTPLYSRDGTLVGMIATHWRQPHEPSEQSLRLFDILARQIADLLQRKRDEIALRETAERYNLAIEAAKMGTWDWDLVSGTLRWTEQCSALMGREHEEIGTIDKWGACLHPGDADEVMAALHRARAGRTTYEPEYRVVRQIDGRVAWVQSIGRFIYDEKTGAPLRMTGVLIDIDKRKQAEMALQRSEELKHRIIESTQDCIKVLDLQGNLLSMNENGELRLEIDDLSPFLNKPWPDFWQPEDREKALGAVRAAAAGGTGRFEGYLPTVRTATPKWWHVLVSPIRDASGQPVQLLAVSRDVTEHKQQEQALKAAAEHAEAANRAKSEFLANMSHEIRTPMNAVVGLAQLLSSKRLPPEHETECLSTLQSSAKQLMILINDMLDLSKIEASTMELEHIAFEPVELVRDCMAVMSVAAEEKGLSMRWQQGCPADIRLVGDPHRIRQIVMNLLSNAVKFTERGSVTLTTECTVCEKTGEARFLLSVRDTGIGMDADTTQKVFRKFTQGDSSITRKYGGTGLGLAISSQLAALMGGDLTVKSEQDAGAEFTLVLPLALADQRVQHVETHTPPEHTSFQPASLPLKVLLVEDYAANILVATSILEQFGHRYVVAKTGKDAILNLERNPFDVVLMDVQMQDLDGYETTRIIRRLEQQEGRVPVPIIAMTAHALAGDREKCIAAGMNDYISKPFDPMVLHAKLARYEPQSIDA